jgi:hypothetical protein
MSAALTADTLPRISAASLSTQILTPSSSLAIIDVRDDGTLPLLPFHPPR